MILTEIQEFICQSRQVSLADMKLHFRMNEETLRPMLKKLLKKGRIRQLPIPQRCDGCICCHLDTLEVYEWVGIDK
ncbi:FeoC like transcriptional regulator [Pleurocapsa sp. PCC 7327]|uniref:FeoC-like transcriptional regulator n=1 Tax=Pleurocapsa sp. PCC 7327 TaxID=118163 RepID=UPI00029FB8D3|nr:FeoC-like transcriptional regulator [Pleurocapsa sp. PCC 7327]AFY78891.1 FeoC like transcriptional regulator [Pleurocapsa sp. PCC 7327]